MLLGMRIFFHLRCRSFRDILIFILSFSVLSLYLTYHLSTLSLPRHIPQDSIVHIWDSQLGDNPNVVNHVAKDTYGRSLRESSPSDVTDSIQGQKQQQQLVDILTKIESQHLLNLKNISKVALIHGQQHIINRDLPLYQDLLLRHQFIVKVPSSFPNGHFMNRNGSYQIKGNDSPYPLPPSGNRMLLSDWWILLCMTTVDGDSESCISNDLLPHLQPYQKINRILGIRNLLWSTEGLCNTLNEARQITLLRKRYISPICFLLPEQYDQFVSVADALGEDARWIVKRINAKGHVELLPVVDQKVQNMLKRHDQAFPIILQQFFPNPFLIYGSPVSLRVYVLLTSILPLKAHLFHEGLVNFRRDHQAGFRKVQGRLWMMSQFWHHIARNYGEQMVQTTINNMQHTIVETLLFMEMKLAARLAPSSSINSKIKYRCQHCFQLLEFEMIFNSSLHPVILEVDGHPPMQEVNKDDGWTGDKVKRNLLSSVIEMLFGTDSVTDEVAKALEGHRSKIGIMGIDCLLSHNLCMTNEDLKYLLDARREAKSRNGFKQIYPALGMENYNDLITELDNLLLSQQPPSIILDSTLSRLSSRHTTAELHPLLTYLESHYSHEDGQNSLSSDAWLDLNSQTSSFFNDIVYQRNRPNPNGSSSDFDGRPRCSEDPTTLPYVRSIHTEPALNISPPFTPAVMDYFVNVSYDQLMVKVWAFALNCQSEARLDEKYGTSQPANYTLGLGDNRMSFMIVDLRHTEPWVINTYTLTIHRHGISDNEPVFRPDSPHSVCSITQECDLRVSPTEPCGMQEESDLRWNEFLAKSQALPFCQDGDATGRWVLPCTSCIQRDGCSWKNAVWAPHACHHGYVDQRSLARCLADKKD